MISRILRSLASIVAASAAVCLLGTLQLRAQVTPSLVTNRLTQPINENSRVTLRGTVSPLANAANDRGPVPDSMPLDRIQVVLKRSPAQEAALKQLVQEQHTPGSANYHKWLTPSQFGEQFGPSDQDVATLEAWLQSKGFNIEKVNAGKQTLEASGSAAQFRTAFHAQIHQYMVNGEMHYANATNPDIPAALAPVFGGFASLNNFRPRSMLQAMGHASYNTKTGQATPEWTTGNSSGVNFVFSPGDFGVQYDLPTTLDGSGQTIAIINESNINVALVNQFRTLFGLPANPPQIIIDGNDPGVNGINNPDGPNGAAEEAYLDVEWAGAVAPKATIDLVIGGDTALENGVYLAAQHAVYGDIAPVMSVSFGNCEQTLGSTNAFFNDLWEQAAAEGITVVVATGDSGSAGCDSSDSEIFAVNGAAVSGWASTPYNVAVGGTDFYYSDYATGGASVANYWNLSPTQNPSVSIKAVIPEQPWNNSQYGLNLFSIYTESGDTETSMAGGGGGASSCATGTVNPSTGSYSACTAGYAKPAWQSGTGVLNDKVRDIPDVSLFAANGLNASFYPICADDGDCQPASGGNLIQITGVGGTSASAPAFAGIMALVNQKYGRQGQADFVLYPLATQFPAAFHDVTNGTNSVPCAYSATASSDSPDCIAVSNPITLSTSGGSVTEGQIGTGTTPEYNATTGYDLATGLGTVDASKLIADWGNVTLAGSTVNLTSPTAGATFTHGSKVTFSGNVSSSGTPTGDVAIETDSTEPVEQGQTFGTLTSGSFSISTSTLPGGTYNVWANYGGDTKNASGDSSKVQITVSPESSSVYFNVDDVATGRVGAGPAIASGATNIPYGTELMLSAQVVPSSQLSAFQTCQANGTSCPTFTSPTGTVAFSDNGSLLNTAVLNAEGDAEYNGAWSVGSHSVTASYAGDGSYNQSSASAITFSVVKETPTLNLYASDSTQSGLLPGTAITVQVMNTANVNGGESQYGIPYSTQVAAPTGTVTLSGAPSGVSTSATLYAGVDPQTLAPVGIATFNVPANTANGNYNVTVTYSGDTNYATTSSSGSIPIQSAGGVASTTTATISGTISPTTTVTISGTVTGKSGDPAPSNADGGVEIYSSGYQFTVPLVPGSGDSSTFSATVSSQGLLQGANAITVQFLGDATYAPSSDVISTPISNPLSDFSMVPNTTIVPVNPGGSATDTIQIASVNGFSGAVTLTCAPASGLTCPNPSAATLSSGGSTTATLNVSAASGTTTGNYNVLLTGTDSSGKYVHTLAIQVDVTNQTIVTQANFALASNPTSLSLSPGATTGNTASISVTPSGNFTGPVTFTCAVTSSPSGAIDAPTCSAPSATVSGTTTATTTLTVNTTAATSGAMRHPLDTFFAAGGGLVVAGLLFFGIPARRRSWRSILALLVFAGIVGMGIGCGSSAGGGGGGGGGGGNSGTTAGAYVLTVTGTSGSLSETTTVNLTVN